jgi:hypothetical protein
MVSVNNLTSKNLSHAFDADSHQSRQSRARMTVTALATLLSAYSVGVIIGVSQPTRFSRRWPSGEDGAWSEELQP